MFFHMYRFKNAERLPHSLACRHACSMAESPNLFDLVQIGIQSDESKKGFELRSGLANSNCTKTRPFRICTQ